MTIRIVSSQGTGGRLAADRYFDQARRYLSRSAMATQVLGNLMEANELVTILIHTQGNDPTNTYTAPECCKRTPQGGTVDGFCRWVTGSQGPAGALRPHIGPRCSTGGCVVWQPRKYMKVVDLATSPVSSVPSFRAGERETFSENAAYRVRPDAARAPWAQPRGFFARGARENREARGGSLPPPVLLIHELGHALQYQTDKAHFLSQMRTEDGVEQLEQANVAAVEQTVVIELRDAGVDVGIRWDYLHDKKNTPPSFSDRWTRSLPRG